MAGQYYEKLLKAEMDLIQTKKELVIEQKKAAMAENEAANAKKECYKQREMTATFERVLMVKKEYGQFSNQYAVIFNKYVNKYGIEDGFTVVDSGDFANDVNDSDNFNDV